MGNAIRDWSFGPAAFGVGRGIICGIGVVQAFSPSNILGLVSLAQACMESHPWRLEIGVRTAAGSTESRPTDVALVQWVKLSKREKTGAVEDLADIP